MDKYEELMRCLMARKGKEGGDVVLAGTAGTGKTTLVKRVIESRAFDTVTLLAPTGKAARRLTQVTGKAAKTVHSVLYGGPVETSTGEIQWQNPVPLGGQGELVVIDEASMIGAEIAAHISIARKPGTVILYVGDPEQLPPVDDTPGVDLKNPDVRLTFVHRSSEGIMAFAYAILGAKSVGALTDVIYHPPGRYNGVYSAGDIRSDNRVSPQSWRGQTIGTQSDSALICYRNTPRHDLNTATRAHLRLPPDGLATGEVLMVMSNNQQVGYVNGESLVVAGFPHDHETDPDRPLHYNQLYVRPTDAPQARPRLVYTVVAGFAQGPKEWREERREDLKSWRYQMGRPYAFKNPRWRAQAQEAEENGVMPRAPGPPGEAVHLNFGYCVTCHKMQGSEADNVGIVWSDFTPQGGTWSDHWMMKKDLAATRAWWYTAVTRARKAVILWR